MYKLFKLAFKLGYKFAERDYYQKLTARLSSRNQYGLQIIEMNESGGEKKERLTKELAIDNQLSEIIADVFAKEIVEYRHTEQSTPFETDINDVL